MSTSRLIAISVGALLMATSLGSIRVYEEPSTEHVNSLLPYNSVKSRDHNSSTTSSFYEQRRLLLQWHHTGSADEQIPSHARHVAQAAQRPSRLRRKYQPVSALSRSVTPQSGVDASSIKIEGLQPVKQPQPSHAQDLKRERMQQRLHAHIKQLMAKERFNDVGGGGDENTAAVPLLARTEHKSQKRNKANKIRKGNRGSKPVLTTDAALGTDAQTGAGMTDTDNISRSSSTARANKIKQKKSKPKNNKRNKKKARKARTSTRGSRAASKGGIEKALKMDPYMKANGDKIARWGEKLISDLNALAPLGEILRKKAVSNKARLLVLAGLEGSGQTSWHSMMQVCRAQGKCHPNPSFDELFIDQKSGSLQGLFAEHYYHLALRNCQKVFDAMNKISSSSNSTLQMLGMDDSFDANKMAYPSYTGAFKPMDRPDVHTLALLAELAGLDLRIVVLQRSARDVILPRLHRKFSSPKILIDNAAALYQQLSMLHPDFFYCVDYDSMTTMTPEDRQHLLDFIHPVQLAGMGEKMFSVIPNAIDATLSRPASASATELPPAGTPSPSSEEQSMVAVKSSVNLTDLADVTIEFYAQQLDLILSQINSLCENKTPPLTRKTGVGGVGVAWKHDLFWWLGQ